VEYNYFSNNNIKNYLNRIYAEKIDVSALLNRQFFFATLLACAIISTLLGYSLSLV
jgi:hypothetical protein